MLKRSHIFISVALLSSVLFGCGKQIPKSVIDPDKMEDILYDYHLAKVMSEDLPYDQSYKSDFYTKYVFDKYNITSAQFDSSMLWYSKHADMLAKIYVKIDKRYSKNSEQMKQSSASVQTKSKKSLSGDSLDIWNKSTLYWLTPNEITNKVAFNLVADTSYHASDMFIMQGDYIFLKDGKQNAVMGINIVMDNDSVVGQTQLIPSSGHYNLLFSLSHTKHNIRSINGFIYYKGDNGLPGVLANNLSIIKVHRNLPPELDNDSTKTNSSEQAAGNKAKDFDTIPSMQTPANGSQPIVSTADTSDNVQMQPLRNDPRSIRDRSPRKLRPKTN